MAKQLLIYESAAPRSALRHGKVGTEPAHDHAFSAGIDAAPVTAGEFCGAAHEAPMVFTQAGCDVVPGVRGKQDPYPGRRPPR